jgi:hypothetical protein
VIDDGTGAALWEILRGTAPVLDVCDDAINSGLIWSAEESSGYENVSGEG